MHSRSTRSEFNNAALQSDSHTYPPAVELFSQGAYAGNVYFVHAGIVKLTRTEANGQEILLDLRFPGTLVGPQPRSAKSHIHLQPSLSLAVR